MRRLRVRVSSPAHYSPGGVAYRQGNYCYSPSASNSSPRLVRLSVALLILRRYRNVIYINKHKDFLFYYCSTFSGNSQLRAPYSSIECGNVTRKPRYAARFQPNQPCRSLKKACILSLASLLSSLKFPDPKDGATSDSRKELL